MHTNIFRKLIISVLCIVFLAAVIYQIFWKEDAVKHALPSNIVMQEEWENTIPPYAGSVAVEINQSTPFFNDNQLTSETYETYSPLDDLGRCGPATACLGLETMPNEARGEIGMIRPSGWHTIRYDDLIEDKYLYNRCHLIAYSLSGENANINNLITGTRYFNVAGMLPYEIRVAQYIEETNNHVLYRVTPVFKGNNLVADGVLMEAFSVEDYGEGIRFNVFIYNIQPGITIDYLTGDSSRT